MMHYDVAVIGGGIAGYSAALRALQAGKKVVLINQGQSALHFSSGSIDVLGRLPDGSVVNQPFDALSALQQQAPEHPYSKVGRKNSEKGLMWFKRTLDSAHVPLHHEPDGANHWRITPLGTLKNTWLSQLFVYPYRGNADFSRIVIVAIDGYRDFQPAMLRDNLAQRPELANTPMLTVNVSIPGFEGFRRNPNELRSIDIARLLRQESAWNALCDQLMRVARADDLVIMPAIMGNGDGLHLMSKLQQVTQLRFHEVPTMPPSLLGIRIEEALHRSFIQGGGVQLKGDKVIGGDFAGSRLTAIHTQNLRDFPISAEHYVIATGSYFSQGLQASQHAIQEPIFALDVQQNPDRAQWRHTQFIAAQSHPFMTFGVTTDANLHPSHQGKTIDNLWCCGAMLSGYDPVFEGCGGGVAIATAYHAVEQILATYAQSKQPEVLL
ncbi:glycerol-3-phosphate dehydrogenase subunit GlpB [Vibrio cholerae]|uniref:glycerol-3-phosphate dehydrogenase subunit GlpB n=1 Tax=Vibrio cholerae TaxID=666 RepID=UPI000C9A0C24|nr:glycerol-3-phosphate dehydrogenase subunit GlpB [Vibrio cholerae]